MRAPYRSQAGQALVLAVALLAAVAAGLVQLFDGGQLLREKVRLARALDAAAYSGALVQARSLNFLAYANRALVAHQVGMAHAITLASWARFGDTQARRLASSNPPASLIGGLFGAAHGRAYRSAAGAAGAGSAADWSEGALARAFAEHDRVVHDVLVRAQAAVQQSLVDARMRTMQAVLAAHYDDGATRLDEALLADTLPGFVVRHGGEARGRLKDMVEEANAHYGFLAPRDHDRRSLLPTEWRCPWLRHELRRRGATSLMGLDAWRSVDTLSFHALRSNRWIGCYYREYPMGWGSAKGDAALADDDLPHIDEPPEDFSDQDFWRWVGAHTDWSLLDGTANPLANSFALSQGVAWQGRGLPPYAGIAGKRAADPTLRFAVRATRAAAAMRTTDAAGPRGGTGRLAFGAGLGAGGLAAVSAASTYYRRPVGRADGNAERPNLFMPYWQASLSPVAAAEREQAWRRQGVAW
ncbi:hypothetical protein EGT29_07820 [Pigmentiphaga sp. H8]|uniref:hypothetical protein n=1 Tax=Pigmentiphaga sp. H8 TaxID=2488560 RepID=UPI000F5AC252|nr:hypothetical protein [Pigmentiphaga sp. H8]AZG07788.1 hypothetical protein EGT29_07820 [Pigmentiphaga sp. H8]